MEAKSVPCDKCSEYERRILVTGGAGFMCVFVLYLPQNIRVLKS